MNDLKHTPGPWYSVAFAGYWAIQNGPYYEDRNILDQDTDDRAEINAKLAATAPDLLNALITMRTAFDLSNEKYADWVATKEIYDAIDIIDLVIKKATTL